jgi:hypothetical protein
MIAPDRSAMFRHLSATLGPDLIINVGLPFLIYYLLAPRTGDLRALLAAAIPPILWGLGELVIRRRIDAISLLSIAGIALSLLALLGGGSVRWLQLREKLATGAIGVALLGSCLIGQPLMLKLVEAGAARGDDERARRLRALAERTDFRWHMMLLTLIWGLVLILDVAVSAALVFVLPISSYLLVNPLLGYTTMGALGLWTFWYARRHGLNGSSARTTDVA